MNTSTADKFRLSTFKFGIEHEVAFLRSDGTFADFENTAFTEYDDIVSQLPYYEQDYPQLRVGDAGIKRKRWYIEGFERFASNGDVIDCPPKGIEIRTTIHQSIEAAVSQLTESFILLRNQAIAAGFSPALTSFHPYRHEFIPRPPLNAFERHRRQASPETQTAHIPMLTQGPDLNLSVQGLTPEQLIDIGRKLTYYSPFIIPFSYSSPFYKGSTWSGLSARTFHRTGARPAAMVFVEYPTELIESTPSLTQLARIPSEIGRIEFKAFDSCGDFQQYGSLLTLLQGLILDQTLKGRATVPNAKHHQQSAQYGFRDPSIYAHAEAILEAVEAVIGTSPGRDRLVPLREALIRRHTPADDMIEAYEQGTPIPQILQQGYSQSMACSFAYAVD